MGLVVVDTIVIYHDNGALVVGSLPLFGILGIYLYL